MLRNAIAAACEQYDYAEWHEAFGGGAASFRDLVFCPYVDAMGFAVFSSVFMLGCVYAPIYIRQGSPAVPFVITLVLAGVWLSTATGFMSTIVVLVVLFMVGIAPWFVIRRIQGL